MKVKSKKTGITSKKMDISLKDELKIEREMLEVALKYKKFLRMLE